MNSTPTAGLIPNSLDKLPNDRLANALRVLRFLRANLRDGCRSWWYRAGTDEFQAGFDLCNIGYCHGRECGGGIRLILRRKHRKARLA